MCATASAASQCVSCWGAQGVHRAPTPHSLPHSGHFSGQQRTPSNPACCAGLRLSAGIKAVWELAQEVEQLCGQGRIRMLDIGGGLSVDYSSDDAPQVWQSLGLRG